MEPTVEKSGRVYSDVSGIQAHSGLSTGCRAGHARSELRLDLAGKVFILVIHPEQARHDLIYGYEVSLPLDAMEAYVDGVRDSATRSTKASTGNCAPCRGRYPPNTASASKRRLTSVIPAATPKSN